MGIIYKDVLSTLIDDIVCLSLTSRVAFTQWYRQYEFVSTIEVQFGVGGRLWLLKERVTRRDEDQRR